MRLVAACLALLLLAPLARAADTGFVRVWLAWHDEADFDRISEYFTGEENTSGRILLRSTPAVRSGFYFLARLATPVTQPGASLVLQIVRPDTPEPKTYTFPASVTAGQSVYELGLTGADFPDKKARPVAWKLELRAADGQVLAHAASFLWEKPASK